MSSKSEEMRRQMLEDPIGPVLFKKAYPTIIIQMITIVYNTADTYFVAKINTEASAAVGVAFSMMALIQAVGFGTGMGANSLISQRLGAKRDEEANKYGSSAMFAGVALGILIMALGLIFLGPLMHMIGADESVLPYAKAYSMWIFIGAPFMCAAFVLNNILRAEGQSFFSMVGMTTGGLLNLVLDPLFIFTFKMGIAGAAVATILSQTVSMVILASMFVRKKSIVRLSPALVSRSAKTYSDIFTRGFPTIMRQGLGSVSSAILNVQAMPYGAPAVAAITIANKIYMLVRNIILGLGQGYQPIAGYCFGGGKKERVRKLFKLTTLVGTVICTAAAIVIFIGRAPIMGWFRDDPKVIEIGAMALMFACIVMPLMAYSTYVNQTYQCLGFAKGATFLASCRQGIMFIPLAFILPALFGIHGIEMLQPAADLLTFIVSIPFQIAFFRKHL